MKLKIGEHAPNRNFLFKGVFFFLLSDKRLDKLHSIIHHVPYANAIHPIKIIPVHQKGLEENKKKANTRFARYLALFQNPFIRTVLNAVAIPMLPSRLKLTHHHVTAAQFENCFFVNRSITTRLFYRVPAGMLCVRYACFDVSELFFFFFL